MGLGLGLGLAKRSPGAIDAAKICGATPWLGLGLMLEVRVRVRVKPNHDPNRVRVDLRKG